MGEENEDLKQLERRIDELLGMCQRLKSELNLLKAENKNLSQEHDRLVEKTKIARSRIETMIGRLKVLERS